MLTADSVGFHFGIRAVQTPHTITRLTMTPRIMAVLMQAVHTTAASTAAGTAAAGIIDFGRWLAFARTGFPTR